LNEKLEVISIRVTKSLFNAIKMYMEMDAHVTLSDFVRDAVREKLKRDAPWLLKAMLKAKGDEGELAYSKR